MGGKSRIHNASTDCSGLLSWKQIEPWQQDNEYILTGYRPASNSYRKCLRSGCQIHNETTNIWTHLLPCLYFGWQLYSDLRASTISRPGLEALIIFHISVATCFLLSTLFHLLGSHSHAVHELGHGLDHLGIVLVFLGTGLSTSQLGFVCDGRLRLTYGILLCSSACLAVMATLQPAFRRPSARPLRLAVYVLLGLSLFMPGCHAVVKTGWQRANAMAELSSFASLAVVNFTGAAIYALRVPERWTQGRTDLIGHSHNIMHILVVVGAVIRDQGLRDAVDTRHFRPKC